MIPCHEPEVVNAIANHPAANQGWGEMDFGPAMADSRNVFFADAGFCAMFIWSAPGVYECHISSTPEARDGSLYSKGKAMLGYMKDRGARMIWGQPSISNRAAICYIRRMGLKSVGLGHNAVIGPVEFFVMEDLQCRPL
jgi:hypothetical protein